MSTVVRVQIQQRVDTASNWQSSNPTLLAGEVGHESDTRKYKLGDGSTAYNSLSYAGVSLLDEDNFSSNSATAAASQQSVKAYVDASALSLIDEDNFATDSATRPPSQQSVKAYVDTANALKALTTIPRGIANAAAEPANTPIPTTKA